MSSLRRDTGKGIMRLALEHCDHQQYDVFIIRYRKAQEEKRLPFARRRNK